MSSARLASSVFASAASTLARGLSPVASLRARVGGRAGALSVGDAPVRFLVVLAGTGDVVRVGVELVGLGYPVALQVRVSRVNMAFGTALTREKLVALLQAKVDSGDAFALVSGWGYKCEKDNDWFFATIAL